MRYKFLSVPPQKQAHPELIGAYHLDRNNVIQTTNIDVLAILDRGGRLFSASTLGMEMYQDDGKGGHIRYDPSDKSLPETQILVSDLLGGQKSGIVYEFFKQGGSGEWIE